MITNTWSVSVTGISNVFTRSASAPYALKEKPPTSEGRTTPACFKKFLLFISSGLLVAGSRQLVFRQVHKIFQQIADPVLHCTCVRSIARVTDEEVQCIS